jgi:hypothetical protein
VLEAVTGAAAQQPNLRVLGMRRRDEVGVCRQLVRAGALAQDAIAGQGREALGYVVAGQPNRVGIGVAQRARLRGGSLGIR